MQLKLNTFGEVLEGPEDLKQRVKLILETPKGSLPHDPEFGSNIWRYADKPFNIAKPFVIAEAVKALRRWEKELEIKEIRVAEASENGRFTFEIVGLYKGEPVELWIS